MSGDSTGTGDDTGTGDVTAADSPLIGRSETPSIAPSRRQAIASTFGAGRPVTGPPARTATVPVDEAPARPADGAPSGRARTVAPLERGAGPTVRRASPPPPPSPTRTTPLPGSAVRRRQVMTVYLPASARRHLYETADRLGVPLGKAAMDALRDSYDVVRARLGTVDRSGPFPDERPRQRSRLDDPRGVSLSLSASQAEAVGRVLTELDCSASVLFSVALDVHATH